MKKALSVILLAVMLLTGSLTGCGQDPALLATEAIAAGQPSLPKRLTIVIWNG